jgi:hypothetical protein
MSIIEVFFLAFKLLEKEGGAEKYFLCNFIVFTNFKGVLSR